MDIALCLAGGGVKGAAHVGVLKALEEENIRINYIGGTSSGSIVATLYACGFSADEIYDIFKKYCKKIKYVDFKNILKLITCLITTGRIKIDGLNSGKQLEKLIKDVCKKKNIENINDIKIPLIIPSVDLCNGTVICFTSYLFRNSKRKLKDSTVFVNDIEIGKAVRASCSYPGVFSPCVYKNTKLIDGGIRENVPWKELKAIGAENIINITFEDKIDHNCSINLIEVASKSIGLLCRELSLYEMDGAENTLIIETKKVGLLDMNKIDELYELGYRKMKEYIKINII